MDPLLTVTGLVKRFPVKAAPFRKPSRVHAVDGIDLTIGRGETVGLVGESGCGKSTLVRLLSRLLDPDEGSILFDGRDFGAVPARRFGRTADRAAIQMVFQDAGDSLNPRWSAFDCIADPLRRLRGLSGAALRERVAATAADCGLPRELLGRLPHQLSGGQKARVGIARAVAVEPKLLILDEPTAALDVSVQVVILRLLDELKTRLGMSYLFVSHDLNVVRLICDRVMVMYLGKMVEAGPADALFRAPAHPYTAALLSAIPGGGGRIPLPGEPRSPIDPAPTVCRFHGRCPNGTSACAETMPTLRDLGGGRSAACHFAEPATLDARIAAA